MNRGAISWHLSRPDAETLRASARDGHATVVRNAEMHMPGRTPIDLANGMHRLAMSHLLLSRPAVITADWAFADRPDGSLWERFRAALEQMPPGQ